MMFRPTILLLIPSSKTLVFPPDPTTRESVVGTGEPSNGEGTVKSPMGAVSAVTPLTLFNISLHFVLPSTAIPNNPLPVIAIT